MIDRRMFVASGGALALSACMPIEQDRLSRLTANLRILEASGGGRLYACALNTESGAWLGWRASERFPMCSSFKLSLAAMVLAMDQRGAIDADERVTWTKDELVTFSPFTSEHIASGATLRQLAQATQETSDNTAANILLRKLGGPAALTRFWRSLGDEVTRLDRYEPALNNVPDGEVRDTTTPYAMAKTVAAIVFGDMLQADNRIALAEWMTATKTGLRRVRAGFPEAWNAGDKTGTSLWPGMDGTYVDIGFAAPPDRPAISFATCYRTRGSADGIDPAAEAILRQTGEVLARFTTL